MDYTDSEQGQYELAKAAHEAAEDEQDVLYAIAEHKAVGVSTLQRCLGVGYNEAVRLLAVGVDAGLLAASNERGQYLVMHNAQAQLRSEAE